MTDQPEHSCKRCSAQRCDPSSFASPAALAPSRQSSRRRSKAGGSRCSSCARYGHRRAAGAAALELHAWAQRRDPLQSLMDLYVLGGSISPVREHSLQARACSWRPKMACSLARAARPLKRGLIARVPTLDFAGSRSPLCLFGDG